MFYSRILWRPGKEVSTTRQDFFLMDYLSTSSGLAEATNDFMPFVILSFLFGLTVSHMVMSHQEL